MPNYPKTFVYMSDPEVQKIRAEFPNRRWSEFIGLLVLSSKVNKDEKSRELAQRELDLFIEKLGA